MTRALRELVRAHEQDRDFPYMDFLGAFMLMERWIRHTGGVMIRRLSDVDPSELLGLPLGTSSDDIKLGYVMNLLRNHGLEVFESIAEGEAREAVTYH